MSLDRILPFMVILTHALSVAAWSTVWVAPKQEECQGRHPCGTFHDWLSLSKPRMDRITVNDISESNTTWIFLPGIHNFPAVDIIRIQAVSNIVLTGDEPCMRNKAQCTIKCTAYLCIFLFIDSQNITVQYLKLLYNQGNRFPYSSLQAWDGVQALDAPSNVSSSCTDLEYSGLAEKTFYALCHQLPVYVRITCWMFVFTRNVYIHSLQLVGYDNHVTFYNAMGQCEVSRCHFVQLPLIYSPKRFQLFRHRLAIIFPYQPATEDTDVLVSGCTFELEHYFPDSNSLGFIQELFTYHAISVIIRQLNGGKICTTPSYPILKVKVTVDNCTFLRTSGVDVAVSDSQCLPVTVQLTNLLVDGLAGWSSLHTWESIPEGLEGSGVNIHMMSPHILKMQNAFHSHSFTVSRVTVSGSRFQNLTGINGIGVYLKTAYHVLNDVCNCTMQIVIEKNIFTDNWGLPYGSIIHAVRTWQNGSSIVADCGQRPYTHPALLLKDNSIAHNRADFSTCLNFNIVPHEHGLIYARRWHTVQQCNDWDPNTGVIHLSGYSGSYFIALVDNSICNNTAMGISIKDSQVLFYGSNTLAHNYAPYGGGIIISGRSQMILMNGTQLHLLRNTAAFTGGGIFVSHFKSQLKSLLDEHVPPDFCFYDLVNTNGQPSRNITSSAYLNVTVTMSDNSATTSGNSLFTTGMKACSNLGILQNAFDDFEVFRTVFHLPSYTDEREVSSLPVKICSCHPSGHVNCSLAEVPSIQVFPGQSLDLWLMIVGEANIVLSGDLNLFISSASYRNYRPIEMRGTFPLKYNERLTNECNKLIIKGESMAKITAGDYFIFFSLPALDNTPFEARKLNFLSSMNLTVLDYCPNGYTMAKRKTTPLCECHSLLQDNHITCHFTTLSFSLPLRYWIGAGTDNTSLLFSDSCLPSYCRDTYTSKEVFLSNLTQQCLHGRVGTLCGECPEGQSVVLGSYNCKECSNYGILVAVVYLVAGPLVIVFICVFNWTVSARSINGLLLYLNIISINSDLLLHSNSFPFVVISWLNFRVGIEMCLFDGMDEFAKTILSFAFPLYLISLVVLIVMVSKCINMHRINKLIGPRITPVLATVILLSYTMLFDSVLKSLLFAQLCSSTDGACTPVWLLDGSLKYFSSTKHIILACLALVILFGLLIPITLIAVIGDLFRRCISNRWYMNFLDTFHSSYRFRWGFWIGLRLVMRIVLLLLKVTVKPEVVWLVTACFSLSLAAVQSLLKPFRHLRFDQFTHRLVNEWCSSEENGKTVTNYLDISFLVNLTALFVSISYLPDSAEVFISLSLCVALIELLLILAYHLVEYSPLGPPLLTATTRAVERIGTFCQRQRHTEEQQCEPADNRQLLGLPLVLRAADCNDEV